MRSNPIAITQFSSPPSATQMEESGGGPDEEAREALRRLHAQLAALEAARAGALQEDGPAAGPPLDTQIELLQDRLGSLEQRVETLAPGARAVLAGAAGRFIADSLNGEDDKPVKPASTVAPLDDHTTQDRAN